MKLMNSFSVPTARGFTLIELLVVIAIIGLLAGIVLASLSSARQKGNDTSLKGAMHSIRTAAAEQFFLLNNAYGTSVGTAGSCGNGSPNGSTMWADTASNMSALIIEVLAKSSNQADCGTTPVGWAVAARLPGGGWWCVDFQGASRGSASSTAYTALTGATGAKITAGAIVCR